MTVREGLETPRPADELTALLTDRYNAHVVAGRSASSRIVTAHHTEKMRMLFAERRKLVIGMVHLLPLPGAGNHTGDSLDSVLERALAEAHALQHGGVDAILIQNSGDLAPALEGGPETIA